jgi:hypothetical protein
MIYASLAWDYAAGDHLLKLQNRVLCAVGNLYIYTQARGFHVAFKIPYVYDCITELCRTQAEVILNHVNPNVDGIGQGEVMHRK